MLIPRLVYFKNNVAVGVSPLQCDYDNSEIINLPSEHYDFSSNVIGKTLTEIYHLVDCYLAA